MTHGSAITVMPAGRRLGIAMALLLALAPIRQGCGASPAASASSTVLVSAGEHGKFSRVVFALGSDLAYRTEPEPAGLRVVFPGASLGFEYGRVYPGRRAHRVVLAEPGSDSEGASFRLRFGCDCSARTFMLDGRLVVDVFDAAPADQPPRSGHIEVPPPPRPSASAADPAAPRDRSETRSQEQPRAEFLRRVETLGNPAPRAQPHAVPEGAGFDADHLERMIAWAIEQGHLTSSSAKDGPAPEPAGRQATDETLAGTPPPDAAPSAAIEQPMPPAVEQELPMASASSVGQEPVEASPAGACPEDTALDMAVLAGDGTFAADLARRQEALSRALAADHGVAEAQRGLAGFYLARLMPHEALQLLRTSDREDPTPTRRWLEAAALVLAGRTSSLSISAAEAASCRGANVELWQAVLHAAAGPLARVTLERDAILSRLADYPPALRVELALRLAAAGIHAKAPEAIARLLDIAEQTRPTEEAQARLLYLRGRLAAARGDFAGARTSWREALHLPGEGSLRATLALLGSELEDGVLDEAWALSTLERLGYDWRGDPAQLSIARLTAAIYEQQGRVPAALRAIEEVMLGAEGRPLGRAAARLATDLMRRAYVDAPSDLSLDQLAVAWRYEGFIPPGSEGADLRLVFAQAMVARGLPNAAIRLLEPLIKDAPEPADEGVVELLVESYLAANQPGRALDLLRAAAMDSDVTKPDRNLLAARALAAMERFAEAAGILHDAPGEQVTQLEADYLWKAGLWQEATAAYRELLLDPAQDQANSEHAVRLSAASYMADQPDRLEGMPDLAGTSALKAFAPLPAPGPAAGRTVATRLLDQATSLSQLAERHGLGGAKIP